MRTPISEKTAMMIVFRKYLPKGATLIASAKFDHWKWFGIHVGGNCTASWGVFRAVVIIQ